MKKLIEASQTNLVLNSLNNKLFFTSAVSSCPQVWLSWVPHWLTLILVLKIN